MIWTVDVSMMPVLLILEGSVVLCMENSDSESLPFTEVMILPGCRACTAVCTALFGLQGRHLIAMVRGLPLG